MGTLRLGQSEIVLRERPRGFHLVTDEVAAGLPELAACAAGLLHLHLMHTSASLVLSENTDPAVAFDLEAAARRLAPDGAYRHADEGPDDMSAHLKNALFGPGLLLPVRSGRLALGTWQGIYLCEHRERGGRRRLIATLIGG
jgi:secondary thiamine-phosphate synthase enzyme